MQGALGREFTQAALGKELLSLCWGHSGFLWAET